MFDLPMNDEMPAYEHVCEAAKSKTDQAKMLAFFHMAQLEGWCSQEKAGLLMDMIFLLKPSKVVEIGVFGGKSLVPMAYALKALNKGVIYGIDPWASDESAKGMDGANYDYWSRIDHEQIYTDLKTKIGKFGLDNFVTLVRATSEEAAEIEDIDIIHIDGNHSNDASMIDVLKWVPLVRSGGIIVFDDIDWGAETGGGNAKAVEYLNHCCIKLAEVKGDNVWGIWVKP